MFRLTDLDLLNGAFKVVFIGENGSATPIK